MSASGKRKLERCPDLINASLPDARGDGNSKRREEEGASPIKVQEGLGKFGVQQAASEGPAETKKKKPNLPSKIYVDHLGPILPHSGPSCGSK